MKFGLSITLAIATAAATAFSRVILADAPPTISPDWKIDLRTVGAVGGVVLVGTWYLGRWMKKIEERLGQGETRFASIEKSMESRDTKLTHIQNVIDSLPCSVCPEVVKRKK